MTDNPVAHKPGTVVGFSSVFTDESEQPIRFEWKAEWVTPEICQMVGEVILEWSLLDHAVTDMCNIFWSHHNPDVALPRPFDRRITALREWGSKIYEKEPEETLTLSWFLQRLKSASGKRHDLAHGRPGRIEHKGRKFNGLLVPSPAQDDRYISWQLKDTARLLDEIQGLHGEANLTRNCLYAAHFFASQGRPIRQVENGDWPATAHSRSPMLPRLKPLPATWRG